MGRNDGTARHKTALLDGREVTDRATSGRRTTDKYQYAHTEHGATIHPNKTMPTL
jgi:hypothetical protein